ncbi:sugar transferase [Staphylococcus haemolyticus]
MTVDTKVGNILRKTSIDEIPQLLNVIKGDMSIVALCPDTPEALNIYKNDESRKLEVKPGITGYKHFFKVSIPKNISLKMMCFM